MSTLFDIVGEFQSLYEMATAEDLDPVTFEDTLESLTGELEVKAAGYVAVLEQLKMESEKADEISKRYQAVKISRENAIKRMKERLLIAMEATGKNEIQAGDFTVKLKNNGGKQPLKITGEVPESFKKVIVEDDKEKIRKYLAAGNTCEWAELEERGRHVEVR